jgi:hypothetical protein
MFGAPIVEGRHCIESFPSDQCLRRRSSPRPNWACSMLPVLVAGRFGKHHRSCCTRSRSTSCYYKPHSPLGKPLTMRRCIGHSPDHSCLKPKLPERYSAFPVLVAGKFGKHHRSCCTRSRSTTCYYKPHSLLGKLLTMGHCIEHFPGQSCLNL